MPNPWDLLADGTPYTARILLRKAVAAPGVPPRTIIGGVILGDLCEDGDDRASTGQLIFLPTSREVMAVRTGGYRMDQMLTGPLNDPNCWRVERT